MKKNLGDADRAARVLLGAVLGVPFLARRIGGTTGDVAALVGAYLLATSVLGWCLFYAIVRASTRSDDDAGAAA